MGKFIDITGTAFGRLTVIRNCGRETPKSEFLWECKCECGKIVKVRGSSLRAGITVSCGCKREDNKKLGIHRRRHGMTKTRPYKTWIHMLERCNNPKSKGYENYGARGITVCEKWKMFEGFWEDMQDGYSDTLTIDRINSNGNYEKENCKWSTRQEQSDNRRNTTMITMNGITENLTFFLDKHNIKRYQYYGRIKWGWSVADALTMPIRKLTRGRAE